MSRWIFAYLLLAAMGALALARPTWGQGGGPTLYLPLVVDGPLQGSPEEEGGLVRLSVGLDGAEANGRSHQPSLAEVGDVAFTSYATNLVAEDSNGTSDVFLHNAATGQIRRLSVASDGSEGNGNSLWPALVRDGRRVVFASEASNLVPGDNNGVSDIFLHDTMSGQTTLLSAAPDGTPGDGESTRPAISADGRVVAFWSRAGNLIAGDDNQNWDVILYDLTSGQRTLATRAADGGISTGPTVPSYEPPALSADGQWVLFDSDAHDLVATHFSRRALFLHDRASGQTTLVSRDANGNPFIEAVQQGALSSDGQQVAFTAVGTTGNPGASLWLFERATGRSTRLASSPSVSYSNPSLGAGPHVAVEVYEEGLPGIQIHRLDRSTGAWTLLSEGSGGGAGQGDSVNPSLPSVGSWVAFESDADDLVPGDSNGTFDIFLYP